MYTLIPATHLDFDFAYELKKISYKNYILQTWGWDEAFQIKFHKESFSTANTKIIKAGDKRVGSVDVKEGDTSIFISGLYILPEFQNRGIGSSILADLEKSAKAGNKRLELEVLRVNVKAQQLYKRMGFVMEDRDETKYFMYKEF